MTSSNRFNDPSPLVCVKFTSDSEHVMCTELSLPEQWSVGHKFGVHASKLKKAFGRNWTYFVGEQGEFEILLKSKLVKLRHVFLGLDDQTNKPIFEIGEVVVTRSALQLEAPTQPPSTSQWLHKVKRLRSWLAVLSGLLGAAAVLISSGQVLGVEIQTLFGLISAAVGTITGLAGSVHATSSAEN